MAINSITMQTTSRMMLDGVWVSVEMELVVPQMLWL